MAELDQITVATHRYISSDPTLSDYVFNRDPLMAYLRKNVDETYTGGREINVDF